MTLFDVDWSGRARASDPPTSHAAAASIEPALPAQQTLVLLAIARLTEATVHEVCTRTSWPHRVPAENVIAKRASELRDAGLIVDTGRVRPGSSHRNQIVWTASDAGREMAQRLAL